MTTNLCSDCQRTKEECLKCECESCTTMTNSEIAQRQAEIDARCAAATPGEWKRRLLPSDGGYRVYNPDGDMFWFDKIEDAEFIAHAKQDLIWQRERIKALEAEVDAAQQPSTQNIAYARVIQDLAENINAKLEKEIVFTNKARKWARWWKRLAKYLSGLLGEAHGWATWALKDNDRLEHRIAALENAARDCATCVHEKKCVHKEKSGRDQLENCLKSEVKYSGWVFDEDRFAPKGSTDND